MPSRRDNPPLADGPLPGAWLDLLRGLAALAVLGWHVRNLYFVGHDQIVQPSLLASAAYFLTGFGHEAVMIFFVLSGFFITGTVMRAWRAGRFRWRDYMLSRLTRLEIVLVPALLLATFWDVLGLALFGTAGIYGGHAGDGGAIVAYNIQACLTPLAAVGNALFLQRILVPVYGSNGPLWSLSYEFWYYVLFPLGLFALVGRRVLFRLVALAAFLAVLAFVRPAIAGYFAVWLFGSALALARPWAWLRGRWALVANGGAFALFVTVMSLSRAHLLPRVYWGDFAVGLAFALWLGVLLHRPEKAGPRARAFAKGLAGFSYTLYLVHLPLLIFIRAWMGTGDRWQPDALHGLFGLGLAAIALAYAYGLSRLTEARTGELRAWIASRLGPRMLEGQVAQASGERSPSPH